MTAKITMLPGAAEKPVKQDGAKSKRNKPSNLTVTGKRRVRATIGHEDDGKPIVKNFYGDTLGEARAERDEFMRLQKERARLRALDVDPDQTVGAWVKTWGDTYGTRGGYSAATTEKSNCDKIKEYFKGVKLSDVREMDVQKFARQMGAKYAKSTISKPRYVTNSIFAKAMANALIDKNPCDEVKWTWKSAGTHRCLEQWEIVLINQHWVVYRAGLWAMLMLWAGLRRGELLALTWEDVDLELDVIHITKGVHFESGARALGKPKTENSIRDVPIFPPLKKALLDAKGEGLVCRSAEGKPVTQVVWDRSWEAYNNTMANVLNQDTKDPVSPGRRSDKDEKLRPNRKPFSVLAHDLRHTFASMLHDADVHLLSAQKWLGHSIAKKELDITAIYQHLSLQKERESIKKMIKYIGKMGFGK